MHATMTDQLRPEPTVMSAVRRYRAMVVGFALLTAAASVVYTLVQPQKYRATATVTVPQPLLSQGEAQDQYLDSQVVLLGSQRVAERATHIANRTLGRHVLAEGDFLSEHQSLEIAPPEAAAPGTYGATITTVSFTWPSATVAQVAVNSVLRAFDEARSAAIRAQGRAKIAGYERAIGDSGSRLQRADLLRRRTQALVNERVDLARHPTVAWATEPRIPVNGNSKYAGAVGLLLGSVLGAVVAFARDSRRGSFDDRLDPQTLYAAPLIGEIPAPGTAPPTSGAAAADALPMSTDPHSTAAEAFRFAAGSVDRLRAARGGDVSLVFVSTTGGADRSAVVANLALAVAESGTRVLAVDADAADGHLTGLLQPDSPNADGFEQVLTGQRDAAECIEPSPLHEGVSVLRSGRPAAARVTGAAYSQAAEKVLAEAKARSDVVLVDCPALLRVAEATELVDACDVATVVLGAAEPIHDHVHLLDRLELVGSEVAGYIYVRPPERSRLAGYLRRVVSVRFLRRTGSSVDPVSPPFGSDRLNDGDQLLSPVSSARR